MKSYAAVEEIQAGYVSCELELLPIEESRTTDYFQKETEMVDIPMAMIMQSISAVSEGDILVVEQTNAIVKKVYSRDIAEKQRRIKLIRSLLGKS